MIIDPTLGQPIRSLQTFLRRIAVSDPDIPRVIPDGIYGEQTEASVIAFRTKYGPQPPVGEVDYATWLRIVEVYDDILFAEEEPETGGSPLVIRAGSESPVLIPLQGIIAALSLRYPQLGDILPTGIHDADSVTAVKKLQRIFGLPQSGTIDRAFREALDRFYAASSSIESD